MAKKAPRNNYYLESYTTVPNQLGRRDARLLCSRRGLGGDLLLQILYNPAGVESILEILRAPRPAAPPKVPRSQFAFSYKPSRLAGAISADVRSAERACRSELIMRERRLRSE